MIVSIDIGTSYSSICMTGPDGKAQLVDIGTGASMFGGKYSLPTAVFVEEGGNVLIGQAAMNRRKSNPQNFRMEFKRNFGEEIPILLGNRSFKPEELYTELFRHMKSCAEKVQGEQIELAYLTCPASYGEKRREKLRSAAKAAGLFQVDLVDEPTAAAMCYCAEGYIQEGQTLLVYDFGGGTFDVSLLEYKDGLFRLLAEPEGLEQCGGIDMDRLIYQDMLGAVEPDILAGLEKNQMHYLRFTSQLAELAVKAKHHLSAAEVFEEDIPIGFDMVPYRLTAEQFNRMIAPLVDDTVRTCHRAMEEAGISASEVSKVLLSGGSSRVPLVREMAKKISPEAMLCCAADLELAVAQGALEYRKFASAKQGAGTGQGTGAEHEAEIWQGARAGEGDAGQGAGVEQGAGAGQGMVAERGAASEMKPESNKQKSPKSGAEIDAKAYWRWGRKEAEQEHYKKAAEFFRKAADMGNVEAMAELGNCYREGLGVPENQKQAVEWYRRAAELGNADGMVGLGNYYLAGVGVSEDKKQGVEWHRRAAELGNGNGMLRLGNCYEHGFGADKDAKQAFSWYKRAIENGCKGAFYWAGSCCEYGKGTAADYKQAVHYYRRAVEEDDCRISARSLGIIYETGGYGVESDVAEAVRWYQKAIELGDVDAVKRLKDLELKRKNAAKQLEKESSSSRKAAMEYYLKGCGAAQRGAWNEAVEWYRSAADFGNADAIYSLGVCYEKGQGVRCDYGRAAMWYHKAADLGQAQAMYHLGVCYEQGRGVGQDYGQAVKWYRRAAESGDNPIASLSLGQIYEQGGYGVTADAAQAVRWYQKAADLGNAEAAGKLQELNGTMTEHITMIQDAALGALVEQFISSHEINKCFGRGSDYFEEKLLFCSLSKLKAGLNVPSDEKILLAHSSVIFTKDQGTIVTTEGIYHRCGSRLGGTIKRDFTDWNEFMQANIRIPNQEEGLNYITLDNGKWISLEIEAWNKFWPELQAFLRSKVERAN